MGTDGISGKSRVWCGIFANRLFGIVLAEACGGKGYYIRDPDEAKSLVHFAMTLVEFIAAPFTIEVGWTLARKVPIVRVIHRCNGTGGRVR